MFRKIFSFVALALVFALALNAAPLGMVNVQAGLAGDKPQQISRVKSPPGLEKSIAETRAARFSPPRTNLEKAGWSKSFSQTAESGLASAVFKDHLYVATSRFNTTGEGAQIFRTADGETWKAVTQPAFGNYLEPGLYHGTYFFSMKVFKDKLYAGMGWWQTDNATFYEPKGGQLWRTADGLNWEKVVDLAGDPYNEILNTDAVFHGQLYGSTVNFDTGFEIWCSPSGDTGDWTKVADNALNTYLPTPGGYMYSFNNTLFVLPDQIMNPDYTQAPVHIWASKDGQNYDVVTADGFGDPRALYAWDRLEFKGDFYLQLQIVDPQTAAEINRIMRTHDGVNWSVFCENCWGLWPLVVKGHSYAIWWDSEHVLQAYRSADLLNWERLDWQWPGFDAPGTTGGWGPVAVFKGDMYFTASGKSGDTQLWRLSNVDR